MRVLVQNVDSIYHTGTLTCDYLRPALLKCSAEQLNLIEHRNPPIRGTLESVWKKLVESEFRSNALMGDSWKTMYWDKVIERKEKLKRLTNSIATAKMEKEKGDSRVRHLVGPLQPLSKARGIKRSLNSSSSSSNSSSTAPMMKRCLDIQKVNKYRR
ncbi:elongin-A-like [Bolinopsis microptera]|uniref:elongin-A-like n=1 Tax=Bolinopsis microptera TaxID=2820187 RepID=UPI003079B692